MKRSFSPDQHRRQTQVRLVLAGLLILLSVGGGLVWLFYGLPAAMTAVLSSGMIYSHVGSAAAVSDIVSRLNKPLCDKTEKSMFTALCLASVDIEKDEMTFTNAGLLKPLYRSGGQVRWLEGNGPRFPLGAVRNTKYEEESITLRSGDIVVFMTDGITEAQNSAREFYGNEHLERLLAEKGTERMSAMQLRDAILKDVADFTGSAMQYDDITVVVVKAEF